MRYAALITVLAVLTLTSQVGAGIVVIDFESDPVGDIAGGTLVKKFGFGTVTFTGLGLRIRQFGDPFPFTRVLSTASDTQPIMVTFSGATADFITITNLINGKYTGEIDIIDGWAFDSDNVLLDFQSNSDMFHTLTGPGIASAMYAENSPGEGYVIDDFTFQIPGPGGLALLSIAAVVGGRRRRRAV